MRATNLTPEQIEALRERARREAGPFTNPAITASSVSHNPEWAAGIIGERSSAMGLTWPEVYLLYIAKQAEPDPPPPPLATARRLECEREEEQRRKAAAEAHWHWLWPTAYGCWKTPYIRSFLQRAAPVFSGGMPKKPLKRQQI